MDRDRGPLPFDRSFLFNRDELPATWKTDLEAFAMSWPWQFLLSPEERSDQLTDYNTNCCFGPVGFQAPRCNLGYLTGFSPYEKGQ